MSYLRDVVTLRLDRAACVGCGRCLEVCPHGVFVVEDGVCRIDDRDACMECGACARNCPAEAVWVRNGVGCAVGLLNTALGRTSGCCGETQACCCDRGEPDDALSEDPANKARTVMDEAMRELIAIGAAVGAHCQPCLIYHVSKAKGLGVSEGDIREAIDVGQTVEKGSMTAMREFAAGVLNDAAHDASPCCGNRAPQDGKSCCG